MSTSTLSEEPESEETLSQAELSYILKSKQENKALICGVFTVSLVVLVGACGGFIGILYKVGKSSKVEGSEKFR